MSRYSRRAAGHHPGRVHFTQPVTDLGRTQRKLVRTEQASELDGTGQGFAVASLPPRGRNVTYMLQDREGREWT